MSRRISSGFFISKNEIWTVNHGVENAVKINFIFKGRKIPPLKIYFDPKTDIAVIIVPEQNNITPPSLGDSDAIKAGDFAFAVGSPYDLENTFSFGIISGPKRFIGKSPYIDFIQTDPPRCFNHRHFALRII